MAATTFPRCRWHIFWQALDEADVILRSLGLARASQGTVSRWARAVPSEAPEWALWLHYVSELDIHPTEEPDFEEDFSLQSQRVRERKQMVEDARRRVVEEQAAESRRRRTGVEDWVEV